MAPETLTDKPRSRLVWFAGWGAAALVALGVAVLTPSTSDIGTSGRLWALLAAALLAVIATLGLRMGIVADHDAVTVTNLASRYTIPWTQLADVELEPVPSDVSIGFHRLVLVRQDQRRIVAAAPTGRPTEGGRMATLQQNLLAMRERYTHEVS